MIICSYVLSSGLDVYGIVKNLSNKFRSILDRYSFDYKWLGIINTLDAIPPCEGSIVLIGSGGTEYLIKEAVDRSRVTLLIYHESNNSLPALIEALPSLSGNIFHYISLEKLDKEDIELFISIIKFINSKLGIIGEPSEWLIYSKLDLDKIKKLYGLDIVKLPLSVLDGVESEDYPLDEYKYILENAAEINVDKRLVAKQLKLYSRLKKIVENMRLNGFTLECFKVIRERGLYSCLPLAIFNRLGLPAACEGDVQSLITMYLAKLVTGTEPYMGNVSIIGDDYIVLSHCTAPLKDTFKLYTHFETGRGVGVSRIYKVGEPVTLLKIDFNKMILRLGYGVLGSWEMRGDLCRTQVKIILNNPKKIIDDSIGNHYVMVEGEYMNRLADAAKYLMLKVDRI